MFKKLFGILLFIILFFGIIDLRISADEKDTSIKKVVSIVYDDSTSMSDDWQYASYSMQNLIGLMNSQDELNVVKMSAPGLNVSIDLSDDRSRKGDIKSVENWSVKSGTPFTAVETAANWLKARKKSYGESQTVEFWLVLITDGGFGGYPNNMNSYLENLKKSMGNSKFEGIFVAIGTGVPEYVKSDFISVKGNHLITASDGSEIVSAMSEVSGLILGQGGNSADLNITKEENNKITFESYFPLRKFIVFEQNQDVKIKKIIAGESKVEVMSDFKTNNPGGERINSRIIHCESKDGDIIPNGKITIEFDRDIDIDNSKFRILIEPAIVVDLKVLDKNGNEIDDLNTAYFTNGQSVQFEAVIRSSLTDNIIDLSNWSRELEAELIVNEENILMKYNANENNFYAPYEVKLGNNLAYSIIKLPGYFRIKSDMLNLYAVENVDEGYINLEDNNIDVSYKYIFDYEEVSSFTYRIDGGTVKGKCNFEFKNIPNGIKISVSDKFINKSGNVEVDVYSGIPVDIKIYRNKDYKEKENSKIGMNVSSNDFKLTFKEDSFRDIILNPVKRDIKTEIFKINNDNRIKLNEIENKSIYIVSVLGDNEYLGKEELETLILNYSKIKGIELDTEVISYNGRYALEVRLDKTLPQIFVKLGKIVSKINMETIYGEISQDNEIDLEILDSITKYIFPIMLIIGLIIIIGYLPGVKNRLNEKKYYIDASGEAEQIIVKMSTRILPYVSEQGSGSDLIIKASNNKNKIYVINNYNSDIKIYVNDEIVDGTGDIILFVSDRLRIVDGVRDMVYVYNTVNNDMDIDTDIDIYGDSGLDIDDYNFGKGTFNESTDDEFFM